MTTSCQTELDREREISLRYHKIIWKTITYLSHEIDGDNPTLDQILTEAINMLEGKGE